MTEQILIDLEKKYGGIQHIPHETRKAPYRGGDRMEYHGYGKYYAKYLTEDPKVIVELGILTGTGLAVWCDVFPSARIIGLDKNLSRFNAPDGAFSLNAPELYEFDKLSDGDLYKEFGEIDVWIDDSLHTTDSILYAFSQVKPYLSDNFVVFIEDNNEVGAILKKQYSELNVICHDQLTVIHG